MTLICGLGQKNVFFHVFTFVQAFWEGQPKIFWGGQMSFLHLVVIVLLAKITGFFCLLVIFFTSKNLASFLVILVQVVQGSQKSLYTGLTHHPGIVQSWSLRSENLRGLGSQENSGCSSDTTPTNWSCFDRIHIWFVTNIKQEQTLQLLTIATLGAYSFGLLQS